jgi:hypothetical protein
MPQLEAQPATISLYDNRSFFEKTLAYGLQQGLLNSDWVATLCADAPKGMVQIARYFGTEFLRPDLEKARDRIVNLVSLYLENLCAGDLHKAAENLRDHTFLSRSKGGSDMLKALIVMPQNTHFGMQEHGGFQDEHIPLLAKWSLRSLPEYQAELALRSHVSTLVDAALWLGNIMGLEAEALEESGKDAEAVIRTALLMHSAKRTELPDWSEFEKLITALRKRWATGPKTTIQISVPKDLPAAFTAAVAVLRDSVQADLPKILDTQWTARKLFGQTPAFMGRYFWIEDALTEVEQFEHAVSTFWAKATGGHTDDSSLLTLFLTVAAGSTPKTLLTEKQAATLVRKIRKSGLDPQAAERYIEEHAPHIYQADYTDLWKDFLQDAQACLQSDMDYALHDALALLRRECHIAG